MKLKLFLISIFALLSLVAYQKYSEYSTLKSIDSYKSCASAKSSLIQESYPATCITGLGARFTQPLQTYATAIKTYTNEKYHFTINYPNTFILETEDLGTAWPRAVALLRRPNSQSYELAIETWQEELDYRRKYVYLTKDEFNVKKYNDMFLTLINFNKDAEVDQIIESFKFTDSEMTQISTQDLNQGWYWGDSTQKKSGTPQSWIYSDQGKNSCWHKPEVSCSPN